jgi:hypothetical protein
MEECMDTATERLEVTLPGPTLVRLRQEARRRGVPEADLVNEAIESLLAGDRQARVRAAEALCRVAAPVGDWADMKQEIEAARTAAEQR